MKRSEILKTPVWTSRMMFNASLLYKKALKDCTEDEIVGIKARALNVTIED